MMIKGSCLTHDPSEYVKQLQQILVSDKKKIAFLFGAGTSLAKKNQNSINIPAIGKLTENIELELNKNNKNKKAIFEIKEEFKTNNCVYSIEALLSNLEQKLHVIGNGSLNGLKKSEFTELVISIKKQIKEAVSIHSKINNKQSIRDVIHLDFAEWIGRANRKHPIEIFTTNYDYLFELGLEDKNIPYYDGFTGSLKPFFNSDSVDDLSFLPKQTKLWKMHGSLGWHFDETSKKVWRKDSDQDDILIYPSMLKYNDSKKQPYTALIDRLSNFLKQNDTVLITCGYSFSDEHINERILTAIGSHNTSHVISLCYDVCYENKKKSYFLQDDSALIKLAKTNSKLSIYGCRSAVIGCQFGKWKLKREPDKSDTLNINLYFDEDAPININDPLNKENKGTEEWTGEGDLCLPDYAKFVKFLQSMILENGVQNE